MIEFLQSIPIYVYGPATVLVSAVIATVTSLYVNRKRKRIWFNANVFPVVGQSLSSRIKVSLDGDVLPDVYVCAIKLLYKGSEPLLEDDFRSPITFEFGDSQVLDVEVTRTEPNGIKAHAYADKKNNFKVDPVALNDNNRVYARALLTKSAQPKVSTHIVGVKRIQHESQRNKLPDRLFFLSLPAALLVVLSFFIGRSLEPGPLKGALEAVDYGLPFLIILMMIASTIIRGIRDR